MKFFSAPLPSPATQLLVLLIAFIAPIPSPAGQLEGDVIRQESRRLEKIHRSMQEQREKVQEARELEKSILGELERLDADFQRQRENLAEMRREMARREHELAEKEQALAATQEAMVRVRQHLRNRLRVLYTMSGSEIITVAFSSRTLPDLLTFRDSFQVLLNHDRRLFDSYRSSLADLTRSREALELHKSLLDSVVLRLEEEKAKLDTIHREKQHLLESIRTREKLHSQAIREMKKAEKSLVATLRELRQERQKRAVSQKGIAPAKQPAQPDFGERKGMLPPPVLGRVVRRFGEEQKDALHNLAKNGIVIRAADGSEVRAVYAGKVVFAAYKRGYGNTVIIDHGSRYYTITARLAEISVKKGDMVKKNELVGKTGDLATLLDEGIYFEIRHSAEPLDPLVWLAPGSLENKLTNPSFF